MAESLDLATLHITVTTKEVKDGISSLDGLSAAGRAEKSLGGLSSAAGNFSSGARQMVAQIMAMVSAYKALETAMSFMRRGIDFSSTMEDSKIAIASVVATVNTISDNQSNTLTGQEKFNAALDISSGLMERIQILGLETTATTQELVSAVGGIIAPATKAGVSLEKLPDFAITATRAMQAMQIPVQQMRTEIEAILSGNINKLQDQLAVNLGITGEMVKNWQKQGTLTRLPKHEKIALLV